MQRNGGRIGKVRMKATGFEFRVIDGPIKPETDCGAAMMRHARAISQWPEMTGALVIGVFKDGTASVGFNWDNLCTIPRALVPSWLAEVVRRELVTAPEAAEVFHTQYEWVE
jgi:hypothetical protein